MTADDPGADSLAADEARLAAVGTELADALESAVPGWIERVGRERVRDAGIVVTDQVVDRLRAAGEATVAALAPRLRSAVTADVDEGAGNPLAVLRSGLGPATEALRELGVPPVERDDFSRRSFPDDHYDLGPAAFADVDESLTGPGVTWGAARAHVHLRRREARS